MYKLPLYLTKIFLVLSYFFLLSCGGKSGSAEKQANVSDQGNQGSLEKVGDRPLIIDVRTKGEYDSGHLEKSIQIHFREIASKIENYTTDKNKKIVVYCASGVRSSIAKVTLQSMGYANVINAGGYDSIKDLPEYQ